MRQQMKVDVKTGQRTVKELPEQAKPPITPNQVKREATRRILKIVPEWKQRNLIAQATRLLRKGESNWTQEEQDAWDAGEAIWSQVDAIRSASDTLENMDPIPEPSTWDGWP